MEAKLLSIVALLFVAISAVAPDCVPDQDKFYWKTPCDGQKYDNRITVTNMKATQNGQDVDTAGGFDLSTDVNIQIDFKNDYGAIQKPLFDASLRVYTRILFGSCQWIDIPTFGFASNLDPCKISPECHVDQNQTSISVTVNAKDIAGPLLAGIIVGDYYSAAITYKDDKTPLSCVYGQDKIIKK